MRPAPDPNGFDYSHPGYPQPKCVICGRFARKTPSGWRFSCVTGDDINGWEHQ